MLYKSIMELNGEEWLVIDEFVFQGVKYYYIVKNISKKIESFEDLVRSQEKVNVEFIYKTIDDTYQFVTDKYLVKELMEETGKRALEKKKI